jgi:hypothetical protein
MKNIAASVRDRLMNQSKASGVPLAALMERFVIGRLLWRVSRCDGARRFVLKGAQLFSIWADAPHRPTRDLDLLGFGDCSPESLKTYFDALLALPADPPDGLVWGEANASHIREDQRYAGVRIAVKVYARRSGRAGAGRYPESVANMPLAKRQRVLDRFNISQERRGRPVYTKDPMAPFSHIQDIPGGGDAEHMSMESYPGFYDADQLYNLAEDPDEQRNLAKDPAHAEKLAEMQQLLRDHLAKLSGSFGDLKPAP